MTVDAAKSAVDVIANVAAAVTTFVVAECRFFCSYYCYCCYCCFSLCNYYVVFVAAVDNAATVFLLLLFLPVL